jgi:ppGpp synthetase/RelA/SpoT-type nucleotidyltranferase
LNFDEYQKTGSALYRRLAELVRDLIAKAAEGRDEIPKVQAYQAREKGIGSLKRKLERRKILDAQDIGDQLKDLAGVRVILYTNIDVDRYLKAHLIVDKLKVHWEETKAHYPSDENGGIKYEGFHYVVSLPDDMIAQAEYADLKDLRCEVQIQTLLAHAFAETSHDIIYKGNDTPGFGGTLRKEMEDRLNKTVDDLLKPAGYELDKVQADFEHLSKGIELFDRREIEALAGCSDNNERYDRLKAIEEYLLPFYDDIGTVIGEVHRALLAVVAAARQTATAPRNVEGIQFNGEDADDVVRVVLSILSNFRYADVDATFHSLVTLYRDEKGPDIRKQIQDVAEKLASYNLHVWQQIGQQVQLYLGDALAKMADVEIDAIRPLAITMWRGLLSSEIDGTSWSADAVTISRGAIPASADIATVRAMAIKGLTGLFDRSSDDDERRPVVSAFWEASQLPFQSNYSNELLITAIRDLAAVADALLPRLPQMKYDLWESIESHLYREYRRFKPLAESAKDDKGVKADAQKLVGAIKNIRDYMNRSRKYVRYKTLVGYEGVFSHQWNSEDSDYERAEAWRKARAARFVQQINAGNAARWLDFIRMCAATKSNDMATFPIFSEFLGILGERRPDIAIQAINTGDEDVLNFLPTMLIGLSKSGAKEGYERVVSSFVGQGKYLPQIVRHLRYKSGVTAKEAEAILSVAIKAGDSIAVIECLAFAVEMWPSLGDSVIASIFLPALEWLTTQRDARWVRGVWFIRHLRDFLGRFDEASAKAVLGNLLHAKRMKHQEERILACIGVNHIGLIWQFFRHRLLKDESEDEDGYQPIPYEFHDLRKILSARPLLALQELRKWFKPGDNKFQFTGGRLLRAAFSNCTKDLADAALEVCKAWTDEDIQFAIEMFRNSYRGEQPIHEIAKALVRAMPEGDRRLSSVAILLENTGVVSGQYGMFDAMRVRKARLEPWLDDQDAKVRTFAERNIRHLANRIATEKRDADMEKEKRKREFD